MNIHTNWSAQDYLSEYYLTGEIAEDELYVFEYLIKFLINQKKTFSSVLDFGCGPTIHHIIPIVNFAKEIYLSDFLQQNLDEVQRWLGNGKNAHDWNVYLDGVLNIEKKLGVKSSYDSHQLETANGRAQLIKSHVSGLLVGDILQSNPIAPYKKKFALVTSFYCAEAATHIKSEWLKAMSSLLNLVEKKGWFITAAIINSDGYKMGNNTVPATNIDEKDMHKVLEKNGFTDIDVKVVPVTMWTNHGFKGIMLAKGKKK